VRDFTGLPKGMDSARYRALGNAVTVSVAEWIARRIMEHGK
jgi:site-specific DNA-cytosine methylase